MFMWSCLIVILLGIVQLLILLLRKHQPEHYGELRQTRLTWFIIWWMSTLMMVLEIWLFKQGKNSLVELCLSIALPFVAGLITTTAWHKKDQLIEQSRNHGDKKLPEG